MEFLWQLFVYNLDKACPLIRCNVKYITGNNNKWVDASVVEESGMLKNLFWLAKNSNNVMLQELYKNEKKMYYDKLKIKKQTYYHNRIDNATNITKEVWNIVNINIGRLKKPINISELKQDGHYIYSKQNICNAFCHYFSKISENLLMSTYHTSHDIEGTIGHIHPSSIFFNDITPAEIQNTLNIMRNKSSSGFDQIPIKVIKYLSNYLLSPLTYIYNLCVQKGTFPENLKLALVIPLHKKGDRDIIDNYRPIALLSSFSKLFEKIISNRISNFLINYNLLSQNQHGFTAKRSTTSATYDLTNYIYEALDKKQFIVVIFFYLTRAFDC